MHREWLLTDQKLIDTGAKPSRNHLAFPVPCQLRASASACCLSHCCAALQTSRSWMPFPHGKRHHRISFQQQIAGRDTAHALSKECCTWQALTPKHSHGLATTHTSSSPGHMFQSSFQSNAVSARSAKIQFLRCFSQTTKYELSRQLFITSLA